MKTNLLFLILLFPFGITLGQWIQKSSSTKRDLFDIKFFENRGVIVGDSVILTSNDSGKTWSLQNYDEYFSKCAFQTKDTIWAVGYGTPPIIKSTNGGLNWNNISIENISNFQGYYQAIFFYDKMHGWVGGAGNSSDGYIFRTADGGKNWRKIILDSADISEISFVDTLYGWASSWNGHIFKTTNGGISWNLNTRITYPNPIYGYPMRSIFFTTKDSGWTVGGIASTSVIANTNNGGLTWNVKTDEFQSDFRSVKFINSNVGWAVGGFGLSIARTTDGGKNWSLQKQPITMDMTQVFESIYMLNSNTGFVVADSGFILKTEDGGVLTGIGNESSTIPERVELFQNYPNPFNPSTIIRYTLTAGSFVTLKIYNNLGQEIKRIVNEYENAGLHSVTFDGKDLPSGIYYYKLQTGDFSQTKKLVLLK